MCRVSQIRQLKIMHDQVVRERLYTYKHTFQPPLPHIVIPLVQYFEAKQTYEQTLANGKVECTVLIVPEQRTSQHQRCRRV